MPRRARKCGLQGCKAKAVPHGQFCEVHGGNPLNPDKLSRVQVSPEVKEARAGIVPASDYTLIEFAERINPAKHGYSPKMAAIVGAIIGYDYGARDRKGGKLGHISITSDGFVTAQSTASDGGGAFLGDARELAINIQNFLKDVDLSKEEGELWNSLYAANVTDWRR